MKKISHHARRVAHHARRHSLRIFSMIRNSKLSKSYIATAIILCALIVAEGFLLRAGSVGPARISELAAQIVKTCESSAYHPSCYDREIPKLMKSMRMEDVFLVTRTVQDMDRSYQYCHVLGHKLASIETAKDTSKWMDVIQRCPTMMCSNGCTHGAFQERFRKETLTPVEIDSHKAEFAKACSTKQGRPLTGLEEASCYHALGHLFMYITDADVSASTKLCREIAGRDGKDTSQVCFDGVFMQIYQPLEPDDFTLLEGKGIPSDDPKLFCGGQPGEKEKASCWMQSWPLSREKLKNPKNLVPFCSFLKGSQADLCFNFMMHVVAQMSFDEKALATYCAGVPAGKAGSCFAQSAATFLDTDSRYAARAMSLCKAAEPYDPKHDCYKELLKYSRYIFNDSMANERNAFCSLMPSPWGDKCLAGTE